jgi:glutathione synthase/RimK-type ligase-like ATP-grasp enzyme
MRRRVALATYERSPGLAPDDRLLIPALEACGVTAEPVVWSSDTTEWETFDAVVIRSCWDYHLHVDAFYAWLDRLEAIPVPVYNSLGLVRWNADKRYLLDLAQRGVPTIPTFVLLRSHPEDIDGVLADTGWRRFVIKPTISASGYETYALNAPLDGEARQAVARVTAVGDALVQPFVEEVPRDGEYSFTFIDGVFSHATLKRATDGEFRVQTEHGGSADRVSPSRELIEQAARVLAALDEAPLYARVDGVVRENAFLLMELELIEPNLFLEFGAGAADRMARAIVSRMRRAAS